MVAWSAPETERRRALGSVAHIRLALLRRTLLQTFIRLLCTTRTIAVARADLPFSSGFIRSCSDCRRMSGSALPQSARQTSQASLLRQGKHCASPVWIIAQEARLNRP
jgi:hypothetical protein